MKIITTSDWHLGNLFHGNDRLSEHKHFITWLLVQIKEQQPDALLGAGDVFDNGNPSAAAQSTYYEFLADATQACPEMQIVITAGNHDSANRLEAARAILSRHKVEIRGNVHRVWVADGENGTWTVNYDDFIIPITSKDGVDAVILAVPYLRTDVVLNQSYSEGVNQFLRQLTARARELYPGRLLIMMAHMYAKGVDIAKADASEKIIIGGMEEVSMTGWDEHPDYLTCGHIHKRQHIGNNDWARYTGSVLPMSFAEKDYKHGVDLICFDKDKKKNVEFLEYTPQHPLCILPENDKEHSPNELKNLINESLDNRIDGKLDDHFKYVVIKVKLEKIKNDDIKSLESLIGTKNAVLCKIQKIIPQLDLTTIKGSQKITSIEDILNRDPLDTLKEAYKVKFDRDMSEEQESMLKELLPQKINQ